MRIGLVIYGRLDALSGGYLYDRKLVEHLRSCGDEVTIISLPWRGYGRALRDNFSADLLRQMREPNFDILLQDELNHPSLAWINGRVNLRGFQNLGGLPIVSIVHHLRSSERHPGWLMPFYRLVERSYLRSVDGFIFNSQTTAAAVHQLQPHAKPFQIAYPAGDRLQPAISDEEIERRAQPGGPLRLLFVGNLIPRKGLHTLLTAVAKLPPPSWQLDVVGDTAVDPAYYQSIQAQIAAADLQPRVKFWGALDNEALSGRYRHNQLLVMPSSYEGFGIVYLEGMGFGLPAIGSTGGAAHEIIQSGENGYLVDPDNGAQLAALLANLHHNRPHLAALSRAARQRYLTHPTWEQTGATIRAFLQRIESTDFADYAD
jgi:glycosyltransferase involved in cell wall biosynthesis